ncbi:MAG: NAD-dependent deacetylase [Treponema sp.]|jgi:NAD-dependent deacetylase|nr:NAD-dependent deacetylase [Treponema sp.]
MDDLFKAMQNARHCIVLTGAGVSTLSGIRDFRGKNGLYKEKNAEKIFDIDCFNRDPSIYYNAARVFIYEREEKKPSIVHNVLAQLEQLSLIKAVITQNIDSLHRKAGTVALIEIHGSLAVHYCPRCTHAPPMELKEVIDIVQSGSLPRCPLCNTVIRPAITFFGENLPVKALRDAQYEAEHADLMVVLGTSLTVNPAAALPEITLRHGGSIAIINEGATPFDRFAAFRFDDLQTVFEYIAQKISSRFSTPQ